MGSRGDEAWEDLAGKRVPPAFKLNHVTALLVLLNLLDLEDNEALIVS